MGEAETKAKGIPIGVIAGKRVPYLTEVNIPNAVNYPVDRFADLEY
jgi:hypothetical protein